MTRKSLKNANEVSGHDMESAMQAVMPGLTLGAQIADLPVRILSKKPMIEVQDLEHPLNMLKLRLIQTS